MRSWPQPDLIYRFRELGFAIAHLRKQKIQNKKLWKSEKLLSFTKIIYFNYENELEWKLEQ